MNKIYVVETNKATIQKNKRILENFFWIFRIFFEVMFESDYSHILRERALEYPSKHIFLLNFLKAGNNVKKKSRMQ